MGLYRIFDNIKSEWLDVSFDDYGEAEDYVTFELDDANFRIYSIYELIEGN